MTSTEVFSTVSRLVASAYTTGPGPHGLFVRDKLITLRPLNSPRDGAMLFMRFTDHQSRYGIDPLTWRELQSFLNGLIMGGIL